VRGSVIAEVMHHASVTSDMGLVEVGLGSMTTIIVVSELKKVYKIQLSVRDCFDSETVGDLVALIEARLDISELDGGGDLCDLV
jgi:acyl carrier protein